MKAALILKSDVLDIIFENRNKAYGAYNLRKFYDHRLLKSLSVMLGIVVVLSAFTFIPKKAKLDKDFLIETRTGYIPPPAKKAEPKPKEMAVSKEKPASSKKFTSHIDIVKDTLQKPIDAITINDKIDDKSNDVPQITGGGLIQPAGGKEGGSDGPGEDPVKPKVIDAITPTEIAEIMPSYPGGTEALRKFLQRNLTNPRDLEEGEMVSVKVRFVVGYDGKLKSFETVQDGGEVFNKEVIRVLKKMPEWIPGKTKGQNVSVYHIIPVKFVAAE
jgi:periplasmic protein TonB